MSIPAEVDVIIIGGGAAGCVIAGRLAAADSTLQVLIVEAGLNNLNDPQVITPGLSRNHLAPTASTMKVYAGPPSDNLAGRRPIVTVAQILGGGSSVNSLMYTRASASDYDDWNTEGWSSEDLFPLFQKCESYFPESGKPGTHGYSGPLAVSYGGYPMALTDEYLKVAQDKGYTIVNDAQDFNTSNAFARWPKWIHPTTGRRSDTAHSYVHSYMTKGTNLHILLESTVSKIIIEDGIATGVETIPTIATGVPPPTHTIKARKLVVLSAGALGSPQILERSGVGPKAVLKAAGITPIIDLPGVGTNYQDHTLFTMLYRAADDTETCDDLCRFSPDAVVKAESEFLEGKGLLTTNYIDVAAKLRPTEHELAALGADFQDYWKEQFEHAKDKPVIFSGMVNGFIGNHVQLGLLDGRYISTVVFACYPASRGEIHITSADPYVDPLFDPGFLSHPADLAPVVWSYKHSRELVRRMPSYRGEIEALHPKFPAGSPAAAKVFDMEDTSAKKDIVYTAEDDKAIEQLCRETVRSTWHGLGTLAMKAREKCGVVDKDLNVYGVTNLKVGDMSICPSNVGSNTYSTAIMIGEKCAVLCGAYLGISNV